MHKRRFRRVAYVGLALLALLWVAGQCHAQSQGGSRSFRPTTPAEIAQAKELHLRSTTQAQRLAAAQRNAARRKAHGLPNQAASAASGGKN